MNKTQISHEEVQEAQSWQDKYNSWEEFVQKASWEEYTQEVVRRQAEALKNHNKEDFIRLCIKNFPHRRKEYLAIFNLPDDWE